MLDDVRKVSPNALGLYVVGDMANSGQETEYQNVVAMHAEAKDAPPLFLTLGNHDFYNNSFEEGRAKFLRYATLPDGSHPEKATYDFWLGGYHFISLSTDEPDGLDAIFHESTMDWLREKLDENRDPSRPTFLFLHQSLYDTVSGSLPGERWNGVKNEQMLRDVLAGYPEVMFFNGHSHWTMDSVSNMFEGTAELPCRIFNCASVGYLWTGINTVTGEHLDGSQGYLVKICGSTLYVLGRDFCTGEWVSAAQYRIDLSQNG
jgi:3',5'-cyclic AMP phosphodiesterase CpdA